jgi:hypothetical protein
MDGFADDLARQNDLVVKPQLQAMTGDLGDTALAGARSSTNTPDAAGADGVSGLAAAGEGSWSGTIIFDLGEGIQMAFDAKLDRNNAELKRRVMSNTGANR